MEGLHITLVALLGVVSCSHEWDSRSVTVRPGDNITLYCYCNTSGAYTVWFKNCTHENQPSLLLNGNLENGWSHDPRFTFVKNFTSDSYDLLIKNVTESDEGTYYCGTVIWKWEKDGKCVFRKYDYNHCNITAQLTLGTKFHSQSCEPHQDGDFNWKLLLSVCSAVAVLSSLLSSFLVFHLCPKTAKTEDDKQRCGPRSQTREIQGEDVCYAAVEVRERSQRPTRTRKTQSSDFSTYSAIKTSQM